MAKIVFIAHDGAEHRITAESGKSLMQAAVFNGVPGIVAECGGCAACATCRVFVAEEWADRVPPASAIERSMLEDEAGTRPHARLSCQIAIGESLDGLVVHVPESQY
jgi:ferredoxin, 2Fe-2S